MVLNTDLKVRVNSSLHLSIEFNFWYYEGHILYFITLKCSFQTQESTGNVIDVNPNAPVTAPQKVWIKYDI